MIEKLKENWVIIRNFVQKALNFFNKTAIFWLIILNLLVFQKYHNIFTYNIPFYPENFIAKSIIMINWIFGFAFLPSISYIAYSYYKKNYKQIITLLLIIIGFDLISSAFSKSGGIGYFFEINFHYIAGPVVGCVFFVIASILQFRKKKIIRKERKIRTATTKDHQQLPSVNLLSIGPKISISTNVDAQKKTLIQTLHDFGIDAKIVSATVGPVVTLYSIELAAGVKSVRLINLADDIARSMQTFSARIATIPGRNLIGIEISNEKRQTVYFKEGIISDKYTIFDAALPLYLGANIHGEHEVCDLSTMPHLLVAGTTGSGKSVGIHTMLLSMLFKRMPNELKLILIDPKKIELSAYEEIPHLLLPVVTESKQAVNALKWAVKEMEDRYRKISKLGARNILTYNAKLEQMRNEDDKMPFVVIVVDEMADLMLMAGKEIEICVQRLAQMGRAAGIHIIMATQRPSVDVVTGTIKANFPTRISFKLSSKIDSRTILGDMSGAEQLLGSGDMLHLATSGKLNRIHGSFVSEEDVIEVVEFWKKQGSPTYIDLPDEDEVRENTRDSSNYDEPYYKEAIELFRSTKKISASFLQRNYPIGYNRAAKIIEQMEKDGIISTGDKFGRNRELL
jgi:S-DNA-T family DNA segregation ATPase FtsK/SpoIIIE